jgi:SPP1 family predicted phage head-tail adaptor
MITSLNYPITLEVETTSTNSVGTPSQSWVKVLDTWANYTIKGGGSKFDSNGVIMPLVAEFYINYRDNFNNNYRVKYNGDYYKILNVDIIGFKEALRISAIAYQTL